MGLPQNWQLLAHLLVQLFRNTMLTIFVIEIIATLLNNGTSPTTNVQILKPETVDLMFKNHVPQFPDYGRQGVPAAKPDLTNPLPNLYPQEGDPPQGWGLTFQITTDGCGKGIGTGRSNGTVNWAGLANLYWWCDREMGVGGMIASQVVPFASKSDALFGELSRSRCANGGSDPSVLGAWVGCEKAIYDTLYV